MNLYYGKNGFTLLEVIFSIALFLLFITVIVSIFTSSFNSANIISNQLNSQGQVRSALATFTNQVRSASYSSIGSYPIAVATGTQLTFYSETGSSTFLQQINYFLSSSTLEMGIINPTGSPLAYNTSSEIISPVVNYVVNTSTPVFTYYNQNYTGTSTPMSLPINISQIQMIGIQLLIDKNPSTSPAILIVETKAEIRNLKTNY